MVAAAVESIEDLIIRLPDRLKDGAWTTADVEAMKLGQASFDQFSDAAARMRLCTFAGYFDRPFLVKGPVENIPVFRVGRKAADDTTPFPVQISDNDDMAGYLRVSAVWALHTLYKHPFEPDHADLAAVGRARQSEPLSERRRLQILTQAGPVHVTMAKTDDLPHPARDGVLAFLETPGVLAALKR